MFGYLFAFELSVELFTAYYTVQQLNVLFITLYKCIVRLVVDLLQELAARLLLIFFNCCRSQLISKCDWLT